MYAIIPSENFCCLDLPDIHTVSPDWVQNGTYLGTDEILGQSCYHYQQVTLHLLFDHKIHEYWLLESNPQITCRFGFPSHPFQDMYFQTWSFVEAPLPSWIFDLPSNCKPSCK